MAGRPTKKRTCAQPVSVRAMPENEKPPAMRVDIYYNKYRGETQMSISEYIESKPELSELNYRAVYETIITLIGDGIISIDDFQKR